MSNGYTVSKGAYPVEGERQRERGRGRLLLLLLASPTCDIQNGRKSNKIYIEEEEVGGGGCRSGTKQEEKDARKGGRDRKRR